MTKYGRYRNLRTPEGLKSSGDAYSSRFGEILVNMTRMHRIVDDTIMYDNTVEEAFYHALEFLNSCAANSVTLNPKKFKFAQKEIEFAGFTLGWDKFHPSKDTLSAIASFPMPDQPTITDIRAWFGLVNQISPFFATTKIMEPFRELLKHTKNKSVYWDAALQELFETSKKTICNSLTDGLTYFDITKPIFVYTDWSTTGIALWQKHCSCQEKDSPYCCKDGWEDCAVFKRIFTKSGTKLCCHRRRGTSHFMVSQESKMFSFGS